MVPAEAATQIHRPRIVLPLGDPAGIGAEVILKALADPSLREVGEFTLVGNRDLLLQTYSRLAQIDPASLLHPDELPLLEVPLEDTLSAEIVVGQGNAASGEASFRFLETAIAQTLAGRFEGIVTAPIAKSAWKAAGHDYPGQTELLAARAGAKRFGMLFVARSPQSGWRLRALLATTHIPLRQVAELLTPELLTLKLELLLDCLRQDFGLAAPRIAVAGLNPHSGEQGQLGQEEQDWLIPWLEAMRQRFPAVGLEGPVPPDTLWVRPGQAWFTRCAVNHAHDAYLALYHDQGLIPVKLMAFDRAVNTTIGLPFVRCSPDHGTAFDIAALGIADATSCRAAIETAIDLVHQRRSISAESTSSERSSETAEPQSTRVER
ncbi:MAG: 4-hydroxythreonine-4-phosphate dehydrogenase PdxA [Pegethrix bostrychoides GSE-TBD4-15B]|jgi:4-hydroxythreonine-4-phosphate dehydrogenase|uniref:4-hydroxythreonine-4-phosphate dehydrogenase n=1 Tax=Pegethrix bostrychoides GSE-TBD4-15B TaxID=2839662 RepID=A0A951P9F3_9CYAN|nr:4-hydroxythreonine-4-phosphate dehydrogenase PdxA [Pegethrix bostrychoides GSE-TBD4-15B]